MEGVKVALFGKVFNVLELNDEQKQVQFLIVRDNGKMDFLNVKVPKDLQVKQGDEIKLQVAPGVFNNKLYYKFVKLLGK